MFVFLSPKSQAKSNVGPACHACGLLSSCKNPKQAHTKKSKNLLVLERPNRDTPDGLLASHSVDKLLGRLGVHKEDYNILSAQACPGVNPEAWKHCKPLLIQRIEEYAPEKIILYGTTALQSVIGWLWGQPAGLQDKWMAYQIPSRQLNAWVCPIGYRNPRINAQVSDIWAYNSLRDAMKLSGRPYDKVPEYNPEILYSAEKICAAIHSAMDADITAFDYETTGLKPEFPGHSIVSASVAWQTNGVQNCVAFLYTDEIADTWKEYLRSRVPKIAANLAFEHRWNKHILGVSTVGWTWDTMLAAHIQDPSDEVTGLKFQAFASLGLPYYASDIEPYFDSVSSSTFNRVAQAPVQDLLRYNGIDAWAELDLGILQRYRAGVSTMLSPNLPKSI